MKNITWILSVIIFLFTSCSKENSDKFYPDPDVVNDTNWYSVIDANSFVREIESSFLTAPLSGVVNAESGGNIRFNENFLIECPENFCFTADGNAARGDVNIELTPLNTNGDWIKFSKSTTNNEKITESHLSFRLKVSQNGNELLLSGRRSLTLTAYVPKIGYHDLFVVGDTLSANRTLHTWQVISSYYPITPFEELDPTGNTLVGYRIDMAQTGWVGCHQLTTSPSVITGNLYVILPANFTNTNTMVYLIYKNDQNSIVRLKDDVDDKLFYINNVTDKIPLQLVSISKIGNNYYYASKQITADFSNSQPVKLEPVLTTKQQINSYLNRL